jgi:hypothetical protein
MEIHPDVLNFAKIFNKRFTLKKGGFKTFLKLKGLDVDNAILRVIHFDNNKKGYTDFTLLAQDPKGKGKTVLTLPNSESILDQLNEITLH